MRADDGLVEEVRGSHRGMGGTEIPLHHCSWTCRVISFRDRKFSPQEIIQSRDRERSIVGRPPDYDRIAIHVPYNPFMRM